MKEHTIKEGQGSFDGLGIDPKLLGIIQYHKFLLPTPIQRQTIPVAIEGKDIIGIAQTGTGKTLAFGIPMIQRLAKTKKQGLILLPTKELALQVDETIKKIGSGFGIRTALVIGGMSSKKQKSELEARPHIIIATPGRLIDHVQQRNVSLIHLDIVVLDEADHMLDIGFAAQIDAILSGIQRDRQTMLFSATMPASIVALAAKYMKLPEQINLSPVGTSSSQIVQEVFFVDKEVKNTLLEKVLGENTGSVLVFVQTKTNAKRIARTIRDFGHTAVEIHSDRSLEQRTLAMNGFKTGKYRVLVATDIAARGIDISEISLVINYDLPDHGEEYVHRIGRTGRAAHIGKAISFATPNQELMMKRIEKILGMSVPVSYYPTR